MEGMDSFVGKFMGEASVWLQAINMENMKNEPIRRI
jgi:hypothetical protein